MKCPKCNEDLQFVNINGRRGWACVSCIELDNNIISMEKCEKCNKFYFKLTNRICDCRQIKG